MLIGSIRTSSHWLWVGLDWKTPTSADGNWRSLARGLTGGYSQVEVTVDSYLDKKSFSLIPNLPPSPFKASGQEGESANKTTLILINYISLEHA